MNVLCDLCGSEVADLAHVCARCGERLRWDLDDIPALVEELEVTLTGRARMSAGALRRSSERRLPFHIAASDKAHTLRFVLVAWARLVSDERGVRLPADDLISISQRLVTHVEWLRHHPAGSEAVTEIRDAVQAVRMVIDRPPDRLYAGPCDACGMPLYARPGDTEVGCRECLADDGKQFVYDVDARRAWMFGELEHFVGNSVQVASALAGMGVKVAASTIRVWASRGKLDPCSYGEPKKLGGDLLPLYRVGDVIEAAASGKAKKAA
ncbi:hypothetical protein AB0I81_34885 [Nonomuraea sp. NPDC050404]|uniref:hypothetical protein n=1 Tax=Nonomuraea sp. NPDC050404 TaxID=3155783 RepID=UPI0033DFA817